MYNSEMKSLPNQRKLRSHEGGGKKTTEKGNISEWLNVIKLKMKNWEKISIIKIHRTKC